MKTNKQLELEHKLYLAKLDKEFAENRMLQAERKIEAIKQELLEISKPKSELDLEKELINQ